jgi:DNA-binding MarR family transcriptional regulator
MYKIKNWEKFNLYNPKNPRYQKKMTWFKFYGTDYINNIDIHKLSFEQKAVLVELWCLGSESDGVLPEVFEIAFRLHYPIDFIDKIVKELFTRGWLEKDYQPVSIEKIRGREDKEKIYVVKTTNRFDEFWESYPSVRKVNKKTCMERWANKNIDAIADEVIGYVKRMKDTQSWKDGFSPAPLTLLNQERWNDGEATVERKAWEGGI